MVRGESYVNFGKKSTLPVVVENVKSSVRSVASSCFYHSVWRKLDHERTHPLASAGLKESQGTQYSISQEVYSHFIKEFLLFTVRKVKKCPLAEACPRRRSVI